MLQVIRTIEKLVTVGRPTIDESDTWGVIKNVVIARKEDFTRENRRDLRVDDIKKEMTKVHQAIAKLTEGI